MYDTPGGVALALELQTLCTQHETLKQTFCFTGEQE
jgi:hypothetical protein